MSLSVIVELRKHMPQPGKTRQVPVRAEVLGALLDTAEAAEQISLWPGPRELERLRSALAALRRESTGGQP